MDNQQVKLYDMAYLVGFFLGDGSLYCAETRGSYQVRFEKADKDCMQKVSQLALQGFGNPGKHSTRNRGGADCHSLIICCRALHDWLAVNTHMRTLCPQDYFHAPETVRKEVLAGLMDADGSAELAATGYVTVRFTNCNLQLINAVRALARGLGISSGEVIPDYRAARTGYRMTLNTQQFAANAYFSIARKQARIEGYLQKRFV